MIFTRKAIYLRESYARCRELEPIRLPKIKTGKRIHDMYPQWFTLTNRITRQSQILKSPVRIISTRSGQALTVPHVFDPDFRTLQNDLR
jgi:hypothetical protein